MLVGESSAPHEIVVEDSPAPQYIVVQESLVPMSDIKDHPCLVVESAEPTEDRAGTISPLPMSGTKDGPSQVDDSLAVPKVNNLCWGGENLVEGGSATLPINFVSPPSSTFPMEDPQPRVLPNFGGGIQRLQRARNLLLLPICRSNHLRWFVSHRNILSWTNQHCHARNRTLLVLSPLLHHPARGLTSRACTESRI